MPSFGSGSEIGPMQNGTTYMVRPRMEPEKCWRISSRIFSGSTQLLVGPASSSFSEQMKVRDSTRATSAGLERARKLFGCASSSSLMRVPPSTSCSASRFHSSSEPSQNTTESGWNSSTDSSIQSSSSWFLVGASPTSPRMVIEYFPYARLILWLNTIGSERGCGDQTHGSAGIVHLCVGYSSRAFVPCPGAQDRATAAEVLINADEC